MMMVLKHVIIFDRLPAAVRELHGVAALDLVAIASLVLAEVDALVWVAHSVVECVRFRRLQQFNIFIQANRILIAVIIRILVAWNSNDILPFYLDLYKIYFNLYLHQICAV